MNTKSSFIDTKTKKDVNNLLNLKKYIIDIDENKNINTEEKKNLISDINEFENLPNLRKIIDDVNFHSIAKKKMLLKDKIIDSFKKIDIKPRVEVKQGGCRYMTY